jgi:hypothetical protein
VNLLPPERNREATDDHELIAAVAAGDDAALRELSVPYCMGRGLQPGCGPSWWGLKEF